jgi:hypothetical protein
MQFTGKSGLAVFVLLISGTVAVGFGSGLLVGRQFPSHRFERFGESWYVLDATTGKVCNPFKDPNTSTTVLDLLAPSPQPKSGAPDLSDLFPTNKSTSNYPPPCGK